MNFLGKIFSGGKRNKKLAEWAQNIPLTENQSNAMFELYIASKKKTIPNEDPLSKLNQDDRNYLKLICSSSFRPPEFGDCDVLRLASFKYFKKMGFSPEQSAILVGMLFNRVGMRDK